jgi:peptidyl-tRNA hydrolase, PTH1 family
MKMIIGLGNPGPKYETTRHNVGFLAVDRLVDQWKASGPISKFQGEIFQTDWKGEKIILAKPLTYMNLSGKCVGSLVQFYQCKPEDLIVIHDDLDLKPFTLRIKTGGGTGGHNGLKSIDESVGKDKCGYHRIRIGIGHPSAPEINLRISPADYVLQQFSDQELSKLDTLLDEVVQVSEDLIQGKIQAAMTRFNRNERKSGEK